MSSYSHIVQWHFKLGIDNFVPPVPFLILNSAIKFLSNYVHCQAKETKGFKKNSLSLHVSPATYSTSLMYLI